LNGYEWQNELTGLGAIKYLCAPDAVEPESPGLKATPTVVPIEKEKSNMIVYVIIGLVIVTVIVIVALIFILKHKKAPIAAPCGTLKSETESGKKL
jgi:heme/copper-type cytochrome/quinol oxidase subunit 2